MLSIGECFLMGWPGGHTKHLHIVINDPNKHGGVAIVVNATKNEVLSGGELMVTNSDHPWLDCEKS